MGSVGCTRRKAPVKAPSVPPTAMFPRRSTDADVTLGDTAVPELMQTDAFELMVHDPNFRALAASPGFKALASNPQVMSALMSNPKAFAALAAESEGVRWRR